MYDCLLLDASRRCRRQGLHRKPEPEQPEGGDRHRGAVIGHAKPDDKFQFERHGYFVAERIDHKAEKPVFNLAVGLKDSWGR